MKTRSKKAAALVLALCLLAGCQGKDAPEGDDAPDTAPIGSGTLQNLITTLGTLSSAEQVDVGTPVSAPILEVRAKVGDQVTEGQVLCTLDTTQLNDQLVQARKDQAQAQQNYETSLKRARDDAAFAQYELDRENREFANRQAARLQWEGEHARALTDAEAGGSPEASAYLAAQAAKDAADAEVTAKANASVGASSALTGAQAALAAKQAELDAAAAAGQDTAGLTAERDALQQQAAAAQAALDAALSQEAQARAAAEAPAAQFAAAEAAWQAKYQAVLAAKTPVAAAAAGPATYAYAGMYFDITKTVPQLQQELQDSQNGGTLQSLTRGVQSAGRSVEDAKNNTAAVDAAKLKVKNLEDTIAKSAVTAPIAGTVVASKAAQNAAASTTEALFSISASQEMQMSGLLNEYDATLVTVGMPAQVTTDATGEAVMDAVVTVVSPTAADASGDFTVTVKLTSPDPALRVGMTGKMRIILAQAEDCFYVPTDSIGVDGDGNSYISVYDEASGQTQNIGVTTGVANDYYTQVTGEGLTADLQVCAMPQF